MKSPDRYSLTMKNRFLLALISFCMLGFAHAGPSSGALAITAESPLDRMQELMGKPAPLERVESPDAVVTLLRMQGSNTIGEHLAPKLAAAYLEAKGIKNVRVQPSGVENESIVKGDLISQGKTVQILIAAHGSSTGFKALMDDTADIWASSRSVKEKEVTEGRKFGDLTSVNNEHILGIDGLAIIVNPKNKVASLTKNQLAGIFAGEITNWSQVGGEDRPVTLYARDDKSGTYDSFKALVLSETQKLSPSALRFESSDLLSSNVAQDEGGIGFIGMAYVGKSKLLAIADGATQAFKPSKLSVATEDYALSRRLYFYTAEKPANPYVVEFLRFAEGVSGQQLVEASGFVSQNVSALQPKLAGDLPEDYLALVKNAERLTVNFRFQPGSAKLDNKAIRDIERLAYYLSNQGKGKKVYLIGFGDKRKSEDRSKLLSKLRAMAVRRELVRYNFYPDETTGYGEFNPVAGEESSGSNKNSRVEVWIR